MRRFQPVQGARNAAYRIAAILAGVERLEAEQARTSQRLAALETTVAELTARQGTDPVLEALERNRAEVLEALHLLHDDEPGTRRRLWEARANPEYEAAYDEHEPLVSVLIPTYTNVETLVDRALPSVLAQTYQHFEVVVVGDAAAPEVEQAVLGLGDDRIRYTNLTHRGPYPEEDFKRWLVAGGPPINEAIRQARGRWIVQMDDDDRARPTRIEVLLNAARERRLEFCYGRIQEHGPDGHEALLCEWPPGWGTVSLNSSIMHAGLRFVTAELGEAVFGIVGDWARIRKMMRVGARIGMIDDVVLDYYPSSLWNAAHQQPGE